MSKNLSFGFEYDFYLEFFEMAYELEKDRFAEGEDIALTVSLGHTGTSLSERDDRINLNVCLFLDYGNKTYDNSLIENYPFYNGYLLLHEIEVKEFYQNKYEITNDWWKGKKFSYKVDVTIPYSYFRDRYEARPNNTSFTLWLMQMAYLLDEERLIYRYYQYIMLDYEFDEKNGAVKIIV